MFESLKRARRGNRLLGTTRFIVLSNFLRTGLVDLLRERPDHSARLDEIIEFHFATATPQTPEDVDLLLEYYRSATRPSKEEFVYVLIDRASWLEGRRDQVKFEAPPPEQYDWNPVIRALHAQYDPKFPSNHPGKRTAARAHWNSFLSMADAFGIVRYENGKAQLSVKKLAKLARELEIFGDGYYGADDLLGVLLKIEALRGDTSWIVRPPPYMLEACDAVARRVGIESYWKFSPRLAAGDCRVLDLACGSGIYSNAFAEHGNQCVAVDMTPWVFYRAFLGARDGVQVECCDMNALPEHVTAKPFTHIVSNLAAHHLRERPQLFANMRPLLGEGGEICVVNYNYSLRERADWNPIAKLKRQFAAQVRYNWSVLEFDRGGVDFISPQDIARELEMARYTATVQPCDPLKELWFVRGVKR